MVRVLVDYVVNDPFGPRLVVADLNLKALYEAQQTAGEVVQGENNMLENEAVPDNVNMDAETQRRLMSIMAHCSRGHGPQRHRSSASGIIPTFSRGFTVRPATINCSGTSSTGAPPTRQSYQDNIDDILSMRSRRLSSSATSTVNINLFCRTA